MSVRLRAVAGLLACGLLAGCETFEYWIGWGQGSDRASRVGSDGFLIRDDGEGPPPAASTDSAAATPAAAAPAEPVVNPARGLADAAGDRVFFEAGDFRLGPKGLAVIVRQAQWLRANPNTVATIAGHADDGLDARDSAMLAQARAEAVRRLLIEMGVAPERLRAVQFGASQPFANSTTAAGRALNRRAVTLTSKL